MIAKSRQMKINKMFRTKVRPEEQDIEYEELKDEINLLEDKVKQKQNEWFKLKRELNRDNVSKSMKTKLTIPFIKPQKIITHNSIERLKKNIEWMSILSGIEVQEYVENKYFVVIYHMQQNSRDEVKHGIKIDISKKEGKKVVNSCMPLGFNLNEILKEFDDIRGTDCLHMIRKALVAYYDRLEQYNVLKSYLPSEAQMCKSLDGSFIQINFTAQNHDNEDHEEPFKLELNLHYRVYNSRPKECKLHITDLPEGVLDNLEQQCEVFKRKPLMDAFQQSFEQRGPFKIVSQLPTPPDDEERRARSPVEKRQRHEPTVGERLILAPVARKRLPGEPVIGRRRRKHRQPQIRYDSKNDDTFQPDKYTDYSESDDDTDTE